MTSPVRVAVPVALMVFTMIVVYGALEMSDSGKSALDIIWDMMYGKKGNSQEIELDTLVQEENEKRSREMPDESLEAVNCVGDWSGTWSACSEDCGTGTQTMDWKVTSAAQNGGTCAKEGTTKSQACKIKECTANEAVNCVLGDWSGWSDCEYNNETGDYVKKRTRTPTTSALNGGTECGPLIEEQTCPAVNCVLSDWQDVANSCNQDPNRPGQKQQIRSPTTEPLHGGKPCDIVSQFINCRVDCVQTAWTNSGVCNSSTGKQSQTRTTTTAAQNSGTVCGSETRDIDCDVNCVQTAWTNSGVCNSSTGKQSQTRTTTTAARNSGTACGDLTREINCDVNCVQTAWTNSGVCNSSTGKQSQTRTTTTAARNSGTACGGETRDIFCAVDCVQTAWTNSGVCSKTCGTGKQSQRRTTTTAAQNSGTACGDLTREINCNTQACPVNCVGNWSNPWGTCSKTCGPGTQTKTWKVTSAAQNGGTCAKEGTTQSQACNIKECPPVFDSFDNDKLYIKNKDGIYLGTGSEIYNAYLGFVTGVTNTQWTHRKYPNGWVVVKKYFTLDGPLDSVVIQGDTPNQPNYSPAVVKAVCTWQLVCGSPLKDVSNKSYAKWNFVKQSDGGFKIMHEINNRFIQQDGNNIKLGDNGDVFYLERV